MIDDKGLELLTQAIIVQASDDYREALCINDVREIKKIERFFRSNYYKLMTDLPGETLIEMLKKECEEYNYDLKAITESHHTRKSVC